MVLDNLGATVTTVNGLDTTDPIINPPNDFGSASDGTSILFAHSNSGALRGTRLSPALVKLDATPFLISSSANAEVNTSVAFDGTNWLVAWEDLRPDGATDIYGAR